MKASVYHKLMPFGGELRSHPVITFYLLKMTHKVSADAMSVPGVEVPTPLI